MELLNPRISNLSATEEMPQKQGIFLLFFAAWSIIPSSMEDK
jgi:hypothetical protein